MMGYSLKCPECRGKFKWDVSRGFPKRCPLCCEDIGADDSDEVVMPFISKSSRKSPDKLYRDMEKGAETRATLAAEMLGVPKSEMSSMKMTNMRDGLREGDIAAMPVNNAVTQRMAQMGTDGFSTNGQPINGAMLSPAVQTGPHPNAGAHMAATLKNLHGSNSPQLRSDIPAIETQMPGYRSRV
jgi:hypothetical protein